MQGAASAFGVADVFSSHRALALAIAAALAVAAFGASAQQPAAPATQGGTRIIGLTNKKIPQCQGLKEPECNTNPDCMFVPQGLRKDGQPIPAYCRAKPLQR